MTYPPAVPGACLRVKWSCGRNRRRYNAVMFDSGKIPARKAPAEQRGGKLYLPASRQVGNQYGVTR